MDERATLRPTLLTTLLVIRVVISTELHWMRNGYH